ncbi:serine/threonine-protein kinase [Enhygromyxa salina]|nr:serine/threonine-protein kinase [Enhygromyxa salina]
MASHEQRAPVRARHAPAELDLAPDRPTPDPDEPSATVLSVGVQVDRYRIIEVIGTGGIGVVYAAFDEALGRKVALKLLRPNSRNPRRLERRRARLIREAQALARLSHPNVVPVYEVGMFEDRVFLAMEYVEGATMRRWLRRSRRSPQEILDKYLQAGRGLAAAHHADIVHRDFKPDNVLVGIDERVRVLDFGLAAPVPEALATGRYATLGALDQSTAEIPTVGASMSSMSSLVTGHGKIIGTPAYMAPEQSRGEPTDARADQYSFCVALWEALFGQRPQGAAAVSGRDRLPPGGSASGANGSEAHVPMVVRRALERGLSGAPEDRFPDMNSLLSALSDRSSGWSWESTMGRRALAGGLFTIIGAGAIALLLGTLSPSDAELCPREARALAGVWDQGVRERVHAQLSALDRPHANATRNKIERELDRWANRWLSARADTCEATKIRAEQSLVLFDVRMACLDRQVHSLAAVTQSLGNDPLDPLTIHENEERLEAALAAVLQLPAPERCARSALISGGALMYEDPSQDDPLEQQRQQLARARSLLELGNHQQALTLVDQALTLVDDTLPLMDDGSQPSLAEAALLRGQILAASNNLEGAEQDLRRAVFMAQASAHDTVSVEACAALTQLLVDRGQVDAASDWYELGHATLARIGADPYLEAALRSAGARLARARGQHRVALADQRRVLEIRERLHGRDHVEVAKILVELAVTHTALERYAEAQADIERALKITTAEFGLTHPEVGLIYTRYAALDRARGAEREALSKQLDALAMFEIAHGKAHPRVATTYAAIAATQLALGEPARALMALEQAQRITVVLVDDGDVSLAPLLVDLGRQLHAAEQLTAEASARSAARRPSG